MATKGNKKVGKVKATIIKANDLKPEDNNIKKADVSTQITKESVYNAGEWIEPSLNLEGFKVLVNESSILPQCIRAYKNNIAGFGIGIRYTVDDVETPEMAAEYKRAEEIIELLNTEQDTKEVFEDLIEAREKYGIAYLEVIRNLAREVTQIEFIRDTASIRKTQPLMPYIETPYYHHGMETMRRKKYMKYRQMVGGKTVYFKEFGDPRTMDNRTGEYIGDGESLERQYQANEIMEFAIGTEPYGEIRWIGQILGVDGSRAAENLNNNYFRNGRHTPLMIMVKGGTLTDESFDKLKEYMNDIKGEAGQHSFLVLEAENVDSRSEFEDEKRPEIEVKDLASILQKDELFQDYLENNRKRVQSAFLLPDLYVGYTTDFNRATAQTAMEVTEEQVFQPERKSLAWAINNRLLNCYRFKYVEVYFMEPDISNPDDLYKMLTVLSNAGGVTPDFAHEMICDVTGKPSENYTEEWGKVPVAVSKIKAQGSGMDLDFDGMIQQLSGQIQKASKNRESDELVAVMKEVRRVLSDIQKQK
ncbi:MAG TPA: phage portal protein [Candidatus Blautia merdigallinarum]|uniref:Phage portal protein n=1 Tax=Candidatus Blautia merdigallinarum TaxID=2838495 RepID=A0A9D2SKR8_9FIRM|nr:phage portal protein [Candidatus Blautia merdigallinarum]